MNLPEQEYIRWVRERYLQLPSTAADAWMLVPVREFDRLQKRIEAELSPRHENIPAAYFSLFGAALATGVAIPALMTAVGLPAWITPTFIVSSVAFLLLGTILVFVAHGLKKGHVSAAAEISQELRDIKAASHGGPPPAPEGHPLNPKLFAGNCDVSGRRRGGRG